jgi:LmbE family N-acetylglucosaminyl deacetylase
MRGETLVQETFRRLELRALARLATPLSEEELRRPAMVFAPHPDDETLGCGGAILRKRRAGAAVELVFLTDGAASHVELISRAELKAMREREALEAAEVLGVGAAHVSLLGFPDGELQAHRAAAVSRVAALLEQHRPEQLFVPYARGEHRDHVSTNVIVHEAARGLGLRATILEYPVWFWRHWPNAAWGHTLRERRSVLRRSLSAGFGLRLLAEFRTVVPIRELLGQKRAALARHASQVQRQRGEPRWSTLGDVDGGAFLSCFFQDYEVYRRLELSPGGSSPARAR